MSTSRTPNPTGKFRFVHQEDGRYVLQMEIVYMDGSLVYETHWKHIPVVNQKDLSDYKPIKIKLKRLAKTIKSE